MLSNSNIPLISFLLYFCKFFFNIFFITFLQNNIFYKQLNLRIMIDKISTIYNIYIISLFYSWFTHYKFYKNFDFNIAQNIFWCYNKNMKNLSYFEKREISCIERLNDVIEGLPYYVRDYFIGIENRTSPLTRLNYGYELRVFFEFL